VFIEVPALAGRKPSRGEFAALSGFDCRGAFDLRSTDWSPLKLVNISNPLPVEDV
jgi:hypothetical protein